MVFCFALFCFAILKFKKKERNSENVSDWPTLGQVLILQLLDLGSLVKIHLGSNSLSLQKLHSQKREAS